MTRQFEVMNKDAHVNGKIKAAIFDFDGTFSTLRCGWEKVMRPLMLEEISGGKAEDASLELQREVDDYIDQSTGIQTVYQMQWLMEQATKAGNNPLNHDEWWYKERYNERLMEQVSVRLDRLEKGLDSPKQYLIKGAVDFLLELKNNGIDLYLASGTDNKDVQREARALGVDSYFTLIKGAPEHMAACSKEAVIKMILEEKNIKGEELLLVGDGKVEVALGKEAGGYAIGAATNEESLQGVNEIKKARLIKACADVIVGDFSELNNLMSWLGYAKPFKETTNKFIDDFFERHNRFVDLRGNLEKAIHLFVETYRNGNKILLCGNGGSASDADHITGELLKGFLYKRPLNEELKNKLKEFENGEELANKLQCGLPAIALTNHSALLSAFANDVDPEMVYAQQVVGLGKKGDLLVGISTSGNAKNVDLAMKTAKALGLNTLGLTGKDGGKLKKTSDICLIAPEKETYLIQECHICFYHLLCAACEMEMFER